MQKIRRPDIDEPYLRPGNRIARGVVDHPFMQGKDTPYFVSAAKVHAKQPGQARVTGDQDSELKNTRRTAQVVGSMLWEFSALDEIDTRVTYLAGMPLLGLQAPSAELEEDGTGDDLFAQAISDMEINDAVGTDSSSSSTHFSAISTSSSDTTTSPSPNPSPSPKPKPSPELGSAQVIYPSLPHLSYQRAYVCGTQHLDPHPSTKPNLARHFELHPHFDPTPSPTASPTPSGRHAHRTASIIDGEVVSYTRTECTMPIIEEEKTVAVAEVIDEAGLVEIGVEGEEGTGSRMRVMKSIEKGIVWML